ncbi:hypothetical protein [Nonomuraea typhae]|uniref:Uncharacterized protein n=1 Tax=Nonomuraea typhae TaxID=2603600 RepID=A0ABW7YJA9_9ACTN
MSESKVFDALGLRLIIGQEVAYAGSDYRGRPTINSGYVQELRPGKAKIHRMARSSTAEPSTGNDERRHVWVNIERIIGLQMYPGDAK